MARRTNRDILHSALIDAISYEEDLITAWGGDEKEPVVKRARSKVNDYRRMRNELFGTRAEPGIFTNAEPVRLSDITSFMDANGATARRRQDSR